MESMAATAMAPKNPSPRAFSVMRGSCLVPIDVGQRPDDSSVISLFRSSSTRDCIEWTTSPCNDAMFSCSLGSVTMSNRQGASSEHGLLLRWIAASSPESFAANDGA